MSRTSEFTPSAIKVALVSFLGALLNPSILAAVATGVFIAPIAQDLGWTRAEIGAGVTFNFWGTALGAALAGRFVDRFGPRAVILPLALVSGGLLAALSLGGSSKTLFYALFFLLGVSVPGAIGYSKLLSGWFFRRRGVALSGLGVGIFLATVIVPPLADHLKDTIGWRGGYAVLGASVVIILLPLLILFAREHSLAQTAAHAPAEDDLDGAEAITTPQVWKSPAFWLLTLAQLGSKFAYGAFMVHAVGILAEQGLSAQQAVLGMSAVGLGGLAAQVGTGWLVDRFNSPRVMLPIALTSFIGLALVHSALNANVVLIGAVLLGVGAGGEDSVMSYMITRFFGVRNFARVYGSMMPCVMILSAPAPIVVGAIFDRGHNYQPALLIMEAGLALGVIAFALLKAFPFPTQDARRLRQDPPITA